MKEYLEKGKALNRAVRKARKTYENHKVQSLKDWQSTLGSGGR